MSGRQGQNKETGGLEAPFTKGMTIRECQWGPIRSRSEATGGRNKIKRPGASDREGQNKETGGFGDPVSKGVARVMRQIVRSKSLCRNDMRAQALCYFSLMKSNKNHRLYGNG